MYAALLWVQDSNGITADFVLQKHQKYIVGMSRYADDPYRDAHDPSKAEGRLVSDGAAPGFAL